MELDKFRDKFLDEANEKINNLEQLLLNLENDLGNKEIIESVFRDMHSLKGGGAMFGFDKLGEFTHDLENIYDLVRNGELKVNRILLDLTLASVDHLKTLLLNPELNTSESKNKHNELIVQIRKIIEKDEKQAETGSGDNRQEASINLKSYYIYFEPNDSIFNDGTNPLFLVDELQTIGECKVFSHFNKVPDIDSIDVTKSYVYWEILLSTKEEVNSISDVFIFVEDDCKLEINEVADFNILKDKKIIKEIAELAIKKEDVGLSAVQNIIKKYTEKVSEETQEEQINKRFSNAPSVKENMISSIRVSSAKLDSLMNLVSELVTTQARLSLFAEQSGNSELSNIAENVQKLTRQLRDNAFDIVLVPIDTMLTRFQRLVRDLSKNLNKKVRFIAEGAETELDKTIIETLTDPLLHILRNCIDHGIELPKERKKLSKEEQGTILLKAFYSGTNVHIIIKDDGSGIDPEKIKAKAIQKGLISRDANLSRKEIYDLLFAPGFSTAENVTDVSGRGVGMDVVKRKLVEVRGEVEIDSEMQKGTTITIKLPLTLSIIDGLLVKIAKNHFIIPLSVVGKIYSIERETVINKFNNLIVLEGERIPFYNLREEFGLPEGDQLKEQIIVVSYEDKKIGIVVDEVVGEYQAVLKALGKLFKNQEIISGATILGDGTVALVMDTNKMIQQFSEDQL
jgi:two-component system, chemotaxis family, sensor kinase CheA